MVPSGMEFTGNELLPCLVFALSAAIFTRCRLGVQAQNAPAGSAQPILDRLNAMMTGGTERVDSRPDRHDATAARRGRERSVRLQRIAPSDRQHRPAPERLAAGAAGRGICRRRDARPGRQVTLEKA